MSSILPIGRARRHLGSVGVPMMRPALRQRGAMEGVSEQSKTPPRPPQVTVAAWMIMVGSVFVVLIVWDRIAALHSLDTRKTLEPILADRRMKDAGIELNDLLAVIRIVSMVAAGCATAMAVLGYQTLQRSRGARLALTVLAVPLFISGLATGGYVSSAVAAAVRPRSGRAPRSDGAAPGTAAAAIRAVVAACAGCLDAAPDLKVRRAGDD